MQSTATHKEVLLHIGSTKTGSSYLQSCLYLNKHILANHGIDYPSLAVSQAYFDNAAKGIVTGGNGATLNQLLIDNRQPDVVGLFTEAFARLGEQNRLSKTLISNEGLCNNIFAHQSRLDNLCAALRDSGYDTIRCLLFVRNPFEHMCSWYLEGLKGTGWAANVSIEEYADSYSDLPIIKSAIENCKALGITINCRNYSNCCRDLLNVFIEWLGIDLSPEDRANLNTPPASVNRSLDYVEQELCRALAKAKVIPATFASPLLDRDSTTNPKREIPYIDPETLSRFQAKNSEDLNYINKFLAANEQLSFNRDYFPQKPNNGILETSTEQIAAIATIFADILESTTTDKSWRI